MTIAELIEKYEVEIGHLDFGKWECKGALLKQFAIELLEGIRQNAVSLICEASELELENRDFVVRAVNKALEELRK